MESYCASSEKEGAHYACNYMLGQPTCEKSQVAELLQGAVCSGVIVLHCRHIEESITIQNISKNDCITIFQDYESDP